MMDRRAMVEEVYKAHDGEYYGMQTGIHYKPSEVENIGNFCWTKPNHAADLWEPDSRDNYTKEA